MKGSYEILAERSDVRIKAMKVWFASFLHEQALKVTPPHLPIGETLLNLGKGLDELQPLRQFDGL